MKYQISVFELSAKSDQVAAERDFKNEKLYELALVVHPRYVTTYNVLNLATLRQRDTFEILIIESS